MLTRAPRGTRDILPEEIERWHHFEGLISRLAEIYGYKEIRTPIFEHTELFSRGVGEETDIVAKEMYSFFDRSQRSLTLRPEGTAPVVRAYLEHKLYNRPQPVKLYYYGPMFRYDRPQAGRYRQFYQFGVEAFGSSLPAMDVEIILLGRDFFEQAGLEGLNLEINSVGCSTCRPAYGRALRDYFQENITLLCADCQGRLERNPLRILDCKIEKCREVSCDAPSINDYLCDLCLNHFQMVQGYLDNVGVEYTLNPRMVRGLDYYTKTAFEFTSAYLGAQNSLGGGGRYDNLVEIFGGPPTPAVGMAIGLDRVELALKEAGRAINGRRGFKVFVATAGEEMAKIGQRLAMKLRGFGVSTEIDYLERSLRAQMKYADKNAFDFVLILGEKEFEEGLVQLRDMSSGEQHQVELNLEGELTSLRRKLEVLGRDKLRASSGGGC